MWSIGCGKPGDQAYIDVRRNFFAKCGNILEIQLFGPRICVSEKAVVFSHDFSLAWLLLGNPCQVIDYL